MGCDIHVQLEWKQDFGKEVSYWHVATFNLSRNYRMFGLLAGVRDGRALVEPRGVPEDIGYVTKTYYAVYPHDELTREHIEEWVDHGSSVWIDEEHGVASGPDWHTASWLTAAEFSKALAAYKKENGYHADPTYQALDAALKSLGEDGRIVFWFDN